MYTLADIIRTINVTASKNDIKVARARLRRLGLTNHASRAKGPYTVAAHLDVPTDTRADAGTVIVAAIAEAA